jgi:hypothetical protein
MDKSATRPGRFQRKVVTVLGVVPNSPTHRRDTIECKLDCGHTRSILRVSRDHVPTTEQCRKIVGTELDCAKCLVMERIRRKVVTQRRVRRGLYQSAY